MYQFVQGLLTDTIQEGYVKIVSYCITILIVIVLCFVIRFGVKFILIKAMSKIAKKTKYVWDDILLKRKVFHRLADISFPVVLGIYSESLNVYGDFWEKIARVIGVIMFFRFFDAGIKSFDEIYGGLEISKIRPIRGLLQVIEVAAAIICAILAVAFFIGESPGVLIGGIGAMTAVTTLIFKDAITGFVAGIQLTYNDLIRIGDWIEAPKSQADGVVIDLSMTTVKVRNFDNTITSVPAYNLVSDAFINWRGMSESGGRRIKRAIYINVSDVRLCDEEMIIRFKKMDIIKDYINSKVKEVDKYNKTRNFDMSEPVNGRRITNIGTFRAYILEYIKRHPGIHKDMIIMVRQLKLEGTGIPLEIYAFTNTVVWVEYEAIQSDIFDHIYSAAGEFGLSIYQQPSGNDIQALKL